MNLSKDVWDRKGKDELNKRVYALLIGVFFAWTLLAVSLGAKISYGWGPYLIYSIFAFIGAVIGIVIYSGSDKPGTSFLGVTVLSGSLGLTIGPILAYYSSETIMKALVMTLGVTLIMSVFGILMPKVIKGAGGIVFVLLSLLLVGYFAQFILLLFGFSAYLLPLDYLAAGLFSLYIWYDWGKAISLPATVDNAIDAAGALIVDVVNLFLALLRIFGRRG